MRDQPNSVILAASKVNSNQPQPTLNRFAQGDGWYCCFSMPLLSMLLLMLLMMLLLLFLLLFLLLLLVVVVVGGGSVEGAQPPRRQSSDLLPVSLSGPSSCYHDPLDTVIYCDIMFIITIPYHHSCPHCHRAYSVLFPLAFIIVIVVT